MTETHSGRQYTTMLRLKPPAAGLETAPGAETASCFQDIYRQEFAYVWHTLRRLGVPPAELEDLAHDVFVVIHRRLVDFDATRAIRPWLFGISYRVASEHRRRRLPPQGARVPDVDIAEIPDQAPSPERILASDEARRRVALALEQLPLDQRAVLVLHDIDSVPVPEIARVLELPLNTVYSRLRLARAKFVAAAAALMDEGDRHV